MARSKHLTARFQRPHRWRRRIALTALLLVVSIIGAYAYLTHPARLAQLAGGLLEQMTGAQVQIGQAEFGFDGLIHLRDVHLIAPQMAGEEKRIFHADEVLIRHDLLSLASGTFVAQSLTFSQPTIYLTEDSATGLFNYEHLRREDDGRRTAMPDHLPEVYIRQGQVVRGEVDSGRYTTLFRVHIDGKLSQQLDSEGEYVFALRQYEAEGEPLTGTLNLRTMKVEVELDRLVVQTRQGDVLPSGLRRWWQMMQPEGEFSSVRISYDPEAQGFSAMLEVRNTELTLPYLNKGMPRLSYADEEEDAERAAAQEDGAAAVPMDGPRELVPLGELPEQQQFRLTDVSGQFRILDDRISIVNLRGEVEGIRYTIDGEIRGLERDAPFRLRLRTDQFELPEEPRFLPALPDAVRAGFDRFRPSGLFRFDLALHRTRGGDVSYQGTVEMEAARFTYARFAYPLSDVKGRISFNDEIVELHDITATGPTGARLAVNGGISPPGEHAAVDIQVAARDVPFDDHVMAALNPRHHPIIDLFRDEQSLARLTEAGLINSEGPLSAGPFEVGGMVNCDVRIARSYGPGERVTAAVDLHVNGLSILFRNWPYPLHLTGGIITIDGDHVAVQDVVATGLRGGELHAQGRVDTPRDEEGNRRLEPQLHVKASGLPLDDLLIAAIGEPNDRWVRDLNLRGMVDAAADIFARESGGVGYRVRTELTRGRAQPFDGRMVLEDLEGLAVVESGRVEIESMQGRYGEGTLRFAGEVGRTESGLALHLDIEGRKLRFEDPLVDLVPPDHTARTALQTVLDAHDPAGVFDMTLAYDNTNSSGRPEGGDHAEQYRLVVSPQSLALNWRGERIALTQMDGSMTIEPDRITLTRLAGASDSGRFEASGQIDTGNTFHADVRLAAYARQIDDTVRLILPDGVLAVIDSLAIDGTLLLTDGHLVYSAGHDEGSDFAFEGDIHVADGVAEVGVAISDLVGTMKVVISRQRGARWPQLTLLLHADQLHAADRAITLLKLGLASEPGSGVITLRDLRGSVYGGMLHGDGQIDLESERYAFRLTLLDAPLEPMLRPEAYPMLPVADDSVASTGEGALRTTLAAPSLSTADDLPQYQMTPRELRELLRTGRLSASLNIEASLNDPLSKQGRGELEIRGARMYELPLAMALLQVLNLAAPASGAFDQADAAFIVDGDLVRFDLVSITAPTIALAGDGTMRYSDRSLDLLMFSSNPRGADLGPVSDMLGLLRDELVSVEVRGTLDDPKPSVTNFRGIRQTWRTLFGSAPRSESRESIHPQP